MIRIIYLFVLSCMLFAQDVPLSDEERAISIGKHLRYESEKPSRYLIYNGFVVSYDSLRKIPDYSLHLLVPDQISDFGNRAKRKNQFSMDYRLGEYSSTNADYKGSNYDRGHLVPAGDFFWNQLLKDETFVLTNAAPQNPNLNRGLWRKIENRIRNNVLECECEALIVTGTTTNPDTTITIGQVGIPASFYKIVYFPGKNTMYAYNAINESTNGNKLTDFQTTVDSIENLTGEDFFDLLIDEIENELESVIIPMNY